MLTTDRHVPYSAWRGHFAAHGGWFTVALLVACAIALAWWGTDPALFPHLGGGASIPVTGPMFMPLLMACVLVLSTGDSMADFSEHAALPRRRTVSVHLAVGVLGTVLLGTVALLYLGDLDAHLVMLRNLLGFLGLSALGAAALGLPSSWSVPLVWALPAFTLGTTGGKPDQRPWWEWPTAPAGSATSWTLAALLAAAGLTTLLLRTGHHR